MLEHPARRKAQLRAHLIRHRVATHAQLGRSNLLEAADWLDLPRRTYTCRTRTTQEHSGVDLTFYTLDPKVLEWPPRDLTHAAGLAEAQVRAGELAGGVWNPVTLKDRAREHMPDAEVVFRGESYSTDWAVEVDLGYPLNRREKKIRAFAEQGYGGILWATSVHARVATVAEEARVWQARGWLPGVKVFETHFIDFWTEGNPYEGRPRCHKVNRGGWSAWASAAR